LELKIEGMGTYGHLLIQIFSAKTAVCPLRAYFIRGRSGAI
jgi:hypothetical protein